MLHSKVNFMLTTVHGPIRRPSQGMLWSLSVGASFKAALSKTAQFFKLCIIREATHSWSGPVSAVPQKTVQLILCYEVQVQWEFGHFSV